MGVFSEMDILDRSKKDTNYFTFLLNLIGGERAFNRTLLLKDLYCTPFYSIVDNDRNREDDGKRLREEYGDGALNGECSVLEMLIGLAKRIESDILYNPSKGDRTSEWFWMMIKNLGFYDFTDDIYYDKSCFVKVRETIDIWLSRKYKRSGLGGLFPLKESKKDQRQVEIWYQMQAFMLENYI